MKRLTPMFAGSLWVIVVAVTFFTGAARAGTCEKWAGKVVSAQGVVEVKPAGETRWLAVKLNETYCSGDTIRTDSKSRADIALSNHPILRLDQNSTVTLGGMRDERTSLVDMISGAALFFSRVTRNLEVRTATVNAGVEGTEFFVRVEEGKTDLTVFEGKVLASNAAGSLPVTTGQSAVAEAGKAPVYRVVVRPRDAVQWALYYPPVLETGPAGEPPGTGDPRFYTARASRLLSVGRVDDALADLRRARELDPGNSNAFALESIIAVTQNAKERALDLARQAVAADPKSATARIALSYAQQASFDLPAALNSVEEAVKLAPGSALAWARLAELQQSFGYLEKSLESAQKAVSLNPDLSRTQTVLGFAHLTRIETKDARGAFDKAIRLDDSDPLPRLGLGLAIIRDGSLEEGRREIEIAMSLDPDSSIIRSYLGKAYYEEKRDKLASGQFGMAKSLDPMDPTPYFYDAIEKQTTNRPAEALQDMQDAIERNDNRMVYRSRLLLDQDVAAREVSLARIYTDLGFQDLALVEAYRSVNTDPTNYSAHRFLSDSYSNMPRTEIARVSELLQAQLLQPINISPIQPSLGESNLLAISGGGPINPSFGEYNPLFERNRSALLLNGLVAQQDTQSGEAVGSVVANKLSASVGYYGFQTEGFRVNDDLTDHIFNLFAQASLSPTTSIQAEYRKRDSQYGFLQLRALPDDFSATRRFSPETESVRVGFHTAFSPGSDLLGNFMYSSGNLLATEVIDPVFVPRFEDQLKTDAKSAELSYLLTRDRIKVVTGAGYFSIDGEDRITITMLGILIDPTLPPDLYIDIPSNLSRDTIHRNAYVYTNINVLKNATVIVGASYDDFSSEGEVDNDESQFNPKFGIIWNPLPATTFRAAAFRALKRTLITDQTLEPTQVAGFNQFYDDDNGTSYWKYGVAVDQKVSRTFWGGAEFSWRNMTVPFVALDSLTGASSLNSAGWHEQYGKAYLNWTPATWTALNGGYSYEHLERDEQYALGASDVKTQRVPLGANFFFPSGLNAMVRATYYDQTGTFEPLFSTGTFTDASNTFWICDAAVSYRLPKRFGFLSFGATNLFNRSFNYFDSDPANPAIQPTRTIFGRINLTL